MIWSAGEIVEHVSFWAESCPCRLKGIKIRDASTGEKRQKQDRCPLQGCQAPACAAGHLFTLLQDLFSRAHSHLVLHPSMAVPSEAERADIALDFNRIKCHFTFWFQVKFSHWGELPWILIGIAHWDDETARRCAGQSLQLFAGSSKDTPHHHRLSVM